LPEAGVYLWQWFNSLSVMMTRVIGGVVHHIPPSEYLAWSAMTGCIVEPAEYAILRDMDAAFCAALSKEIAEVHARHRAAQDEKSKSSRKRKG